MRLIEGTHANDQVEHERKGDRVRVPFTYCGVERHSITEDEVTKQSKQ
jgi:hypothetical protein